jgi:hypothetical protein
LSIRERLKTKMADKEANESGSSRIRLVLNDSTAIKGHMTRNFLPNFYASPESALKMMTNTLVKLISFPSYRAVVFSCYDVTSCS